MSARPPSAKYNLEARGGQVQLQKSNVKPLLSTVRGQPNARKSAERSTARDARQVVDDGNGDDGDVDVDAPPLSSSDEDITSPLPSVPTPPAPNAGKKGSSRHNAGMFSGRGINHEGRIKRTRTAFSNKVDQQVPRAASKDESEGLDAALWTRSSGSQYGSQTRSQKASQSYGKKRLPNFHEPMEHPTEFKKPRKQFQVVPGASESLPDSGAKAKFALPPRGSQDSTGSRKPTKPFRMPECNESEMMMSEDIRLDRAVDGASYVSNSTGSPFSSPPPDLVLDDDSEDGESDDAENVTRESKCPLCGKQISASLFDRATTQSIGVRARLAACREHRRETAMEVWRARNYPQIEWHDMDDRLDRIDHHMTLIIEKQIPSHFREMLRKQTESGEIRRLVANPGLAESTGQGNGLTMLQDVMPGYYGPRGARVLQDHIMRRYGKPLQSASRRDPLMVAAGITGYVQRVLVPEMATMLVIEDRQGKIDAETARTVLEESREVGNLVNDELDEYVDLEAEDDEESRGDDAISDGVSDDEGLTQPI